MAFFGDGLFKRDMRNKTEKRILKTIENNDVEALKKILKNPVGCRLGSNDTPILLVAVMKSNCAMIQHLIDSGCDSREIDKDGRSALGLLFSRFFDDPDDEKLRLEIADILLATYSNAVEVVFLNSNEYKTTLFLLACCKGFDAIILRFLALLDDTNSISMDHKVNCYGENAFHLLFDDSRIFLPPARLETVRALIDKLPYSDQLIDAVDNEEETPLYKLLVNNEIDSGEMIELVNLIFCHGASPENGTAYLDCAVMAGNVSIFETLLRAGCRSRIFEDESLLLQLLMKFDVRYPGSRSRRMIELLLAFGYDLQQELFLYTIDERPIEFASPENAELRNTRCMDVSVLGALQELRRSNQMLSLQRQCRNAIRRPLKARADEVIGKLTCIPDRIKSYLLVQNEMPLL